MSKFKKAILIFIIALLAIVIIADIGVYIWLGHNPDRVARILEERTGNKIEVKSVKGEFLFGFNIRGLVVYPSDNPLEQRLIAASSIHINISFPALFKGKLYPSKVILDKFDVFFTINEKGQLVLPTFSPYAAQGGVAEGPLDLPGDIRMELQHGSIYLDWHSSNAPTYETGMSDVSGKGSFTRGGEIIIAKLAGKPEFASLGMEASGRIDPFDKKDLDVHIKSQGVNVWKFARAFRPLFAGIPNDQLPTGTADCEVDLKGPFDALTTEGKLSLSPGKLASIKLASGEMNFKYAEHKLEVKDGIINCYGGTINLDGELLLDRGPAYRFYIDFNNLDINAYLEEIQLYFQETMGSFQGHFEGYGEFNEPDSFIADGYFTSGGGTYLSPFHKSIPTSPERLSYKGLRVDFEVAHKVVGIENLLLDSDELSVLATGTLDLKRRLDLKGQMRIPMQLAAQAPELKKWAPLLPKAKSGEAIVNFTLEGDILNPRFEAKLPESIFKGFIEGNLDIGKVGDLVGDIF